jgi:hypothetical protein
VDLVVVVEKETGAKSGECGRKAVTVSAAGLMPPRPRKGDCRLPCEIHYMIRPEEKKLKFKKISNYSNNTVLCRSKEIWVPEAHRLYSITKRSPRPEQ